jgi:glutathione peroxidase
MLAHTFLFAAAFGILAAGSQTAAAQGAASGPVLQFRMNDIDGRPVDLARYKGKVLLLVNVASECGFTPQYEGLQKLHTQYGKDGLVILGFPCNDFGAQEPGSDAQVKDFAKKTYGVTFELFSKVRITKDACPLYQHLTGKDAKSPGAVRWNFEKFLIGRDGNVVARFGSNVEPDSQDLLNRLRQELERK